MTFGALYQIADGLFVGRFIGEDALAAVNIVMPVIMMVFAFSNMVATGASVRIAVLLGEKPGDCIPRILFHDKVSVCFILLDRYYWLFPCGVFCQAVGSDRDSASY